MPAAPLLLIIEPNTRLTTPYNELPSAYSIMRVSATQQAAELLKTMTPDVVLLSTSYSMTKILEVLDQIKLLSTSGIIPVVFVVDWSHKMSCLPGTTWAGKVGILHTLSNPAEVEATLTRVRKYDFED
jgi:response regulator RpfG family c-di-GMP phosphodiesterase